MWDYRSSLAKAVNRARTKKRLTKRYVAEKIGTDARTVSNIEKCESNTTLDVLCPLLELLEIDPREALCPTMTQESPSHFQFRRPFTYMLAKRVSNVADIFDFFEKPETCFLQISGPIVCYY